MDSDWAGWWVALPTGSFLEWDNIARARQMEWEHVPLHQCSSTRLPPKFDGMRNGGLSLTPALCHQVPLCSADECESWGFWSWLGGWCCSRLETDSIHFISFHDAVPGGSALEASQRRLAGWQSCQCRIDVTLESLLERKGIQWQKRICKGTKG